MTGDEECRMRFEQLMSSTSHREAASHFHPLVSALGAKLRAMRAADLHASRAMARAAKVAAGDDGRMADYTITGMQHYINDYEQWSTPPGAMPIRGWSNVAPAIVEIAAAYGLHLDPAAVWDWLKWRRAVVRREGACDLVMYLPQQEGAAPEHVVVSLAHGCNNS